MKKLLTILFFIPLLSFSQNYDYKEINVSDMDSVFDYYYPVSQKNGGLFCQLKFDTISGDSLQFIVLYGNVNTLAEAKSEKFTTPYIYTVADSGKVVSFERDYINSAVVRFKFLKGNLTGGRVIFTYYIK